MAKLDALFRKMLTVGASDLHMTSGRQPMFRLDGDMVLVEGAPVIDAEKMLPLLMEIAQERHEKDFMDTGDVDFAYELPGQARFRVNFFQDHRGPAAVFRVIPSDILTAEQLGLPQSILNLCQLSKGLVVVTGPTGSGKSTTLAAMVDFINKTRNDHIITIEDPIEFVHQDQRCLVNQREVGEHTTGFKKALRAALREDPDIVLVGEMRDLETIEIAMETAETGHLVFGTLHTTTAASTVDRIIDQFPEARQPQVRTMLAGSLKGVVAQTLCKKKSKGRLAALELLICTKGVSALIREGKTHQIPSAMQTGGKHGMKLLNDALLELVQSGDVAAGEAYRKSVDRDALLSQYTSAGIKFDPAELNKVEPLAAPAPAAALPAAPTPSAQTLDMSSPGLSMSESTPPAALPVQSAPVPPPAPIPAAPFPQAAPAPVAPEPAAQPAKPGADPFEQFRNNRG
ncbi:MAG: twitching motility protein PilT [Planctomycetota bacterium]|jgi:twitching motility protein PilT